VVAVSEDLPYVHPPDMYVCRNFQGVLRLTTGCKMLVVDIPIGLPDGSEPRECDVLARRQLSGDVAYSVVLAPSRRALSLEKHKGVQQESGRQFGGHPVDRVSVLRDKICEVDDQIDEQLQSRVRQFHPELTWARLATRSLPPKGTKEGMMARHDLLMGETTSLESLCDWGRSTGRCLRLHELLDALVGLRVAKDILLHPGQPQRVAGHPQQNQKGLRMEIYY